MDSLTRSMLRGLNSESKRILPFVGAAREYQVVGHVPILISS